MPPLGLTRISKNLGSYKPSDCPPEDVTAAGVRCCGWRMYRQPPLSPPWHLPTSFAVHRRWSC